MRQIRKLKNLFWLKLNTKVQKLPSERLGSEYGGWVIPTNLFNQGSICYLAGAGVDISFDVAIAEKYQCPTFIFDPTPQAKKHFEEFYQNTLQNQLTQTDGKVTYQIQKDNLSYLKFVPLGLWDSSTTIKFYKPSNTKHVSHSALNIQKTNDYIEVEAMRLSELMQQNQHTSLDLLKLDIEGSEYKVIDSLLEDKLDIKVICIEFDETHTPLDNQYLSRIGDRIQALQKQDYLVINIDSEYNFTFVRKDVYEELKP